MNIILIRRQPVGQILPHLNVFAYGDETLCKTGILLVFPHIPVISPSQLLKVGAQEDERRTIDSVVASEHSRRRKLAGNHWVVNLDCYAGVNLCAGVVLAGDLPANNKVRKGKEGPQR